MNAPLVLLAVDVSTIVCAALLGLRTLISRSRSRNAWLIALMAFAIGSGVLLGHQDYGYWMPPAFRIDLGGWAILLNLARNLTAGLFMLLCFSLFTDRRRFPNGLLILLALQLGLEEPGDSLIPAAWAHARFATQTAPALLQTLFAGFALYWTVAGWRADLIEARRRTRALTLVVGSVLTIVSGLLTRVLIDPDSRANYVAHVAVTVADLAILVFVLLKLTGAGTSQYLDFEPDRSAARLPRAADADLGPALSQLSALLNEERIWAQEGLSLKGLASRVGLPEYRLRKLIHEQLGYRNFNTLLHDHRIREACRQLSDPALRRVPILTIALSVGYASINTFSRGFREVTGETPSVWRHAALTAAETSEAPPKGK